MNTQLWDRQPEETGQAYAAFLLYRDLPIQARSVAAAYFSLKNTRSATEKALERGVLRKLPEPPNSWKEMFSAHDWKKRTKAWDRHQSELLIGEKREQAVQQGLHFRQERQFNYADCHLIHSIARQNVLANLREGDLCERREKTTKYTKEKGWQTTEHRTLMREQIRLVQTLGAFIYPPDNSIPVDEDGVAIFFNQDAVATKETQLEVRQLPYPKNPAPAAPCYVRPDYANPPEDAPKPGPNHVFPPVTIDSARKNVPKSRN